MQEGVDMAGLELSVTGVDDYTNDANLIGSNHIDDKNQHSKTSSDNDN